jgi:hypothetical protein
MKKEWIYIQVVYADTHEEAIDQVIGGEIDMEHELNGRVIEPEHLMSVLSAYIQDKEDTILKAINNEINARMRSDICPSRDDAQPHISDGQGRCKLCYTKLN